jgi:hypothetical protein
MPSSRLLFTVLVGLFSAVYSATAASETGVRDRARESDPIYEKLWQALEVLPLEDRKETVIRIYDESTNLTISASGDRVVIDLISGTGEAWDSIVMAFNGMGERIKDAEKHLTVTKHRLELANAEFAADVNHLASNLDALDTHNSGLDGGYTYFDARSKDGRLTTFEVWSPRPQEHPLTCELQGIFLFIPRFVLLTGSSKEAWEDHDHLNFMMGFTNVSGIGLTREVAKGYILEAFKNRIHKLVNALKGI